MGKNYSMRKFSIQSFIEVFKVMGNNKVIRIFIIVSSIAFIQAINSVFLGRILTKENFGVYSFLFASIVPLVTAAVLLGQGVSIIRYFSKGNFLEYKWKKYLKNTLTMILGLISVVLIVVCIIYKMSFAYYFILLISIFSLVLLRMVACLLRSKGKFEQSTILQEIPPVIFLFLIGILILFKLSNLNTFLILKTTSYIVPFLVIICFFLLKMKEGAKEISRTIYTDGLFLWGISLTQIAMGRVDSFFIVKYLDFKALAEYSIISLFMAIFGFVSTAIWSVYSQKFSSSYEPKISRFLSKIIMISISIFLFYVLFGKFLLHFLFKGKYDSAIYLLLPFCTIGCLQLIYLYPACYFAGKSHTKTLILSLKFNIIGIAIKIISLVLGIIYFGLLGAALSGILIWCFRNTIGYFLVFRDMKMKKLK